MRTARARHFVAALRDAGAEPKTVTTLDALAKACSVTPDYLGMVLRGARPLAPSIVATVATTTGLSGQVARACFVWARGLGRSASERES